MKLVMDVEAGGVELLLLLLLLLLATYARITRRCRRYTE